MSIFSDAKTYAELLHLFDVLGAALNASRGRLPYPDIDARHVAFRGMQEVIAGYAMGFSSMIYKRNMGEIIESFGTNNLNPDEARRIIEDAWKNGISTLFHFKVDSLFQNLLRALGLYRERSGFATMVDQILAVARPAELDHVRDVLMLIGYLRNSLHNNGIHRGGNLSVRFLDMEYDLTRDNAVACASWQHELAALFKTIGIIDEILAAPAIRNLQVPIPDAYALNPVT